MTSQTSSLVRACGRAVAKSCDLEYGLLVGNGTSSLALACELADPQRRKTLVPSIACTHVLYAVLFSGRTPVFVDVCPDTGLIDPSAAIAALDADPEIGAVIVVHTYGNVADLPRIAQHARSKDILVVEDAAQAHGGRYIDGSPLGSLGDVSVVSFGHTKILDVGGGGAVLSNDADAFEKLHQLSLAYSERPSDHDRQMQEFRSSYYGFWHAAQREQGSCEKIGRLFRRFQDAFFHQASDDIAANILHALPRLGEQVPARAEAARQYTDMLAEIEHIKPIKLKEGAAPWRFVGRVGEDQRDSLLSFLRDRGIDASSWYPDLGQFIAEDDTDTSVIRKNAAAFEKEVINLWVNGEYDVLRIDFVCELIKIFFNSKY